MSSESKFFQTSLEGVYLSTDGYFDTFRSGGVDLIEPSDIQLQTAIEQIYGRGLRPLGGPSEAQQMGWLWAHLGFNYEAQRVFEMATQAAGIASGIIGGVGTAVSLLKAFGILDNRTSSLSAPFGESQTTAQSIFDSSIGVGINESA